MKKPLLERVMAYKKNCQTVSDTAKEKFKNSDIKTSKRQKKY